MGFFIYTKKNTLKHVKAPYVFRVKPSGVLGMNDLLREIGRGNTTITEVDASGCLKLERDIIAKYLAAGNKVVTEWCSLYVTASGTAQHDDEEFSPDGLGKNHRFDIHVQLNSDFRRKVLREMQWYRKENFEETYPVITDVVTVHSDIPLQAKQGDMIRLEGRRMAFDYSDERYGVFFADPETGNAVRSDYMPVNDNTLTIARIPDSLPDGNYGIEIRTAKNGSDSFWKKTYEYRYVIKKE